MSPITSQALLLLGLLGPAFCSPVTNPKTLNITPRTEDTISAAQVAANQASQRSSVNLVSRNYSKKLMAAALMCPAINMKVSALDEKLTKYEQVFADKLGVDTTSSSPTCAQVMVIYARGTTEPGNVGLFAGPPFFDALKDMMGADAVSVQGVEYSASKEGFVAGGDPAGSAAMVTMIESTTQNCPDAKVVMSGYGQGGQLVHNAAAMLPVATMAKVNSVIIFSDPDNGAPVANADASKTLVICHPKDKICNGGDLVTAEHLTYCKDADEAATFAANLAKK